MMCSSVGATAVRIEAVDGNNESDWIDSAEVGSRWDSALNSKFDTKCVVSHAIPLTPSERGCIASHIRVWRLIANMTETSSSSAQGSPNHGILKSICEHCIPLRSKTHEDKSKWWHIVCEDDAAIISRNVIHNFQSSIRRILNALPNDCDICYLGHATPSTGIERKSVNGLFLKPSYVWQMHAYMLTPSSAKKLLGYLPVSDPVDNFVARLINEGKVQVICCIEMLKCDLFMV